jgi:hemerythrin-like domain-containing protein
MSLKRHLALQDYSREHHDELLLVWKIREGLKKNIAPKRIIDYTIHHCNDATLLHMAQEEKYILNKLSEQDADVIKIMNEHTAIKKLVKQFSLKSVDKNSLLFEFANLLEKHIRFEERTFFPKLQNTLPDDIIKSMQPLEIKEKEDTKWEDAFWMN